MVTRATPWTVRLNKMLDKGPISRDEAVAEMASLVPPGRAYRDTERVLKWVREKHHYKSKRATPDKEQTKDVRIKGGQKRIVRSALWTQIKLGHIEAYEENGIQMLRKAAKVVPPEAPPEAR